MYVNKSQINFLHVNVYNTKRKKKKIFLRRMCSFVNVLLFVVCAKWGMTKKGLELTLLKIVVILVGPYLNSFCTTTTK